MATTSVEMARASLRALDNSGIEWAILHGAHKLQGDSISDIDLVVRGICADWVSRFCLAMAFEGLGPIVVHPYDVGAMTIFLSSSGLKDGVQLDLMEDPDGRGRMGLKSGVALEASTDTDGLFVLNEVDSWLYSLRKRHLKGQYGRVGELIEVKPADQAPLVERARELFSERHAELVAALILGERPTRLVTAVGRQGLRYVQRLRMPAGLWVFLEHGDEDKAAEVGRRLGRFLLRSKVAQWPPAEWLDWPSSVALVTGSRWRAGVVVTTGTKCTLADVVVDGREPIDEICEAVRVAAIQRAATHLMRSPWCTKH